VTVGTRAHSTNGAGVAIAAGSTGSLTVLTGGLVEGVNGVNINSATGSTISNSGTIQPTGTGFAINATGAGAVTITNNATGVINRAVSLTAQNDTFTNNGTFNNTALSSFGAGNDVMNNNATFNASANVDFGAGTDVFNNGVAGTVRVAPAASTATTISFLNLETFNNAGTITLANGHSGDVLSMPGTAFAGSGNSALITDVDLGAGTADQLQVGLASGMTNISVNRVGTGFGSFGETIQVVTTTGGASSFALATPVNTGFVQFTLQTSGNNVFLVGSPTLEAFEAGRAAFAGETFWSNTADVWHARMQEVRDSSWSAEPTRGEGWEMWAQAHAGGQQVSEKRTFTAFGNTSTNNLGLDSDWRGFQMGADTMRGGWLWGVTGGFVQQESRLHANRNSFDLEGWNLGAYAGFTSGRFFLNGLLKGDWYSVDANFHTVPVFQSFDGNTWGVSGETGFRFGGAGLFVEPIATAEWSRTHLDNWTGAGVTFSYNDASFWKGKIGARFGTEWGGIIPYIGVYAADTWSDRTQATFTTGTSSFSYRDEPLGSYGMVDYGFTTKSWNGLEGFLKGESYFSGHVDGFTGRLGVRWRW